MRIHPLDGLLFIFAKLLKSLDRRQTGLEHFDPSSVKNILVVSSTAIGDTLLSTPAIRAVRERYPKATIMAHFNAGNMALFKNNPHINGIIPYYGGYRKFMKTVREFRKYGFDLALIFHGNEPQATPMAYLSGARFIFKIPNTSNYRFLLSNNKQVLQWDDFSHGVEQRLAVAELAHCTIRDKTMVLPVENAGGQAVDAFLEQNGSGEARALIGFQVGASTISRMWFSDRFIALGRKLLSAEPGLRIIITGSPGELDYCRQIADGIGAGAIVSAGAVPLKYIPSLVSRFDVLVTGDTGIMHVAIAVGTPVVALFAVADAKRSGPYYDMGRHTIIQKWRVCEHCLGKKCTYQKCMENISVDEVNSAVIRYLEP